MNKYIICLTLLFITFSCSNNKHKKEVENYKKQKEINSKKLYYPKAYDDYWVSNPPLFPSMAPAKFYLVALKYGSQE